MLAFSLISSLSSSASSVSSSVSDFKTFIDWHCVENELVPVFLNLAQISFAGELVAFILYSFFSGKDSFR